MTTPATDAAKSAHTPADRRPLKSRQAGFAKASAAKLAAMGVSPNAISVIGMCCGLAAGACELATRDGGWFARLAWLLTAAFIQARLMANLLDGMVAVEWGHGSPVGVLYNEIPDRVSDAAVLIGAGYAAGGSVVAGFVATILAFFTAYVRTTGNSVGTKDLFLGPMAKQQRMATLTGAACYFALTPIAWHGRLLAIVLWVIAIGCVVTSIRRIDRIVIHLKAKHD